MDNNRPGRLPEIKVSHTGTGLFSVFPQWWGCPFCKQNLVYAVLRIRIWSYSSTMATCSGQPLHSVSQGMKNSGRYFSPLSSYLILPASMDVFAGAKHPNNPPRKQQCSASLNCGMWSAFVEQHCNISLFWLIERKYMWKLKAFSQVVVLVDLLQVSEPCLFTICKLMWLMKIWSALQL